MCRLKKKKNISKILSEQIYSRIFFFSLSLSLEESDCSTESSSRDSVNFAKMSFQRESYVVSRKEFIVPICDAGILR